MKMIIKLNLSGYDIIYNGAVIYFGYMPDASDEERLASANEKVKQIEKEGVEGYIRTEPIPTLSETDEAILNTNANVEYLVALKELEV